jgi:uncharacterized membrane protein
MSRGRVLLRAALLLVGGAYMLWRAFEARRLARLVTAADAVLQQRLALVWALVGALAILTGLGVLYMLRPRRHRRTLVLGDRPPGDGPGPPI